MVEKESLSEQRIAIYRDPTVPGAQLRRARFASTVPSFLAFSPSFSVPRGDDGRCEHIDVKNIIPTTAPPILAYAHHYHPAKYRRHYVTREYDHCFPRCTVTDNELGFTLHLSHFILPERNHRRNYESEIFSRWLRVLIHISGSESVLRRVSWTAAVPETTQFHLT